MMTASPVPRRLFGSLRMRRYVALFGLVILVGCDLFVACEEAVCTNGIQVTINDIVSAQVTVEFVVDGEVADDIRCDEDCVIVFTATPDSITIRVIGDTETVEMAFTPEYRRILPNGPQCRPRCFLGVLEMSAPV